MNNSVGSSSTLFRPSEESVEKLTSLIKSCQVERDHLGDIKSAIDAIVVAASDLSASQETLESAVAKTIAEEKRASAARLQAALETAKSAALAKLEEELAAAERERIASQARLDLAKKQAETEKAMAEALAIEQKAEAERVKAAAAALQTTDTEHSQVVAAHEQQVKRLRFESQRAERQFMQSEPENRLVTGELERRWEAALRGLKSAEEELDRLQQDAPSYMIPEDLLEMLRDAGPRLPEIWNAKLLGDAQKKALLRSLIDKVMIHRLAPDQVQTRVVWRGGLATSDVV